MQAFEIKTPVITVNRMYRGRRFLTKDGRETKDAIALEVQSQSPVCNTTDPIALNVIFYFPNKRRRDVDNCLKALLDCCTGLLYADDSQIEELHVYKKIDAKNPRTVVQVL